MPAFATAITVPNIITAVTSAANTNPVVFMYIPLIRNIRTKSPRVTGEKNR
jgi:hypothetical protein